MTRYLVTGGAGFIGSNLVHHIARTRPGSEIRTLDALTYAAVPATVDDLAVVDGHRFIHGDIRDPGIVAEAMDGVDVVFHLAAESHVDRSIAAPATFLETNVTGTGVLLDAALRAGVGRFVHVSTDEVYGSLPSGRAPETAPLRPSSPYSASKAGSDLLALSYGVTFGLDVVVTRCTNNYGPYQFPEKLIPLAITTLADGGRIPLYGDGMQERDWLHVTDHCSALLSILDGGEAGTVYNIGADAQRTNRAVAHAILDALGLDEDRIEFVADRPGHDRRYAVDSTRVRGLGWAPRRPFEDGIVETVGWYQDHPAWWRSALEAVR